MERIQISVAREFPNAAGRALWLHQQLLNIDRPHPALCIDVRSGAIEPEALISNNQNGPYRTGYHRPRFATFA